MATHGSPLASSLSGFDVSQYPALLGCVAQMQLAWRDQAKQQKQENDRDGANG